MNILEPRGPFERDAAQSCLSGPLDVYMTGSFILHQQTSAAFVFPHGSITGGRWVVTAGAAGILVFLDKVETGVLDGTIPSNTPYNHEW